LHGNDKNGLEDIDRCRQPEIKSMQANKTDSSLNVLRIDASARLDGSVSRRLADGLLEELDRRVDGLNIVRRDLAQGLPFVDAGWVAANFTDPAQRDDAQHRALAHSDALVEEVKAADLLVIATPIYNFGVPATLKAWMDQIARARLTFRYTEHGPEGLLAGKKAYVLVATGGTAVGGEIDFATPWLRFVLGFMGITDVTVVAADHGMARGDDARRAAVEQLDRLLARDWPEMAEAA
jgi:FMN-dependent NADH-azoreductase